MKYQDFTPQIFSSIKNGYNKTDLKSDIIAGFTVAVIAFPLSMALAIASGTSPDKGLITAIIAGFFISAFGGSKLQIGGPTGAFTVIIFNVIQNHGYDGLLIATIIAGIILIVAGYLRFGQSIKYIPYSVIVGFTSGIAIIIASSQIKDFFGLNIAEIPSNFITKWLIYFKNYNHINYYSFFISLLSLSLILVINRFFPKVPSYITVVILMTAFVMLFNLPITTIGTNFPEINFLVPKPSIPYFDLTKIIEVIPSAFIIAFLAGIESLLSATIADGMTGLRHRPNQELIGQGIANIFSSIFGGIAATGAIARTAANIKSGAKTPFAGIFHSLFLLIFVLFTAKLIIYLPLAVLSAILLIVAWNMSEIHNFINIYKSSKGDRLVLLTTFILTITVDLTVAISVGVILSLIIFIKQVSKNFEISNYQCDDYLRENLPENTEILNIRGIIFFPICNEIIEIFSKINQTPKTLIIRLSEVPLIDYSGIKTLENLIFQATKSNMNVIFCELNDKNNNLLAIIKKHQATYPVFYQNNLDQAIKLAKKL